MAASPRRVTLSPTAAAANNSPVNNAAAAHNTTATNSGGSNANNINTNTTMTNTPSPGHNTNGVLHSPSNNTTNGNTGGGSGQLHGNTPPGGPNMVVNNDKGGNGHQPVTITVVNHGGHGRAAAYGQASSHQPVPATPLAISRQNSADRSILTSGIRLQPPSEKRTDGLIGSTEGAAGTIRSNKQRGTGGTSWTHTRCSTRCLARQIWWIVLVIGVAAAAMTYVFSYRAARDSWVSNFARECMERRTYISNTINSELNELKSLVTLFTSLSSFANVSRTIFEAFGKQLVDEPDGCELSVAWYKRVDYSDRTAYLTWLRTIYNDSNLTLTPGIGIDASSPIYPLTYTSINDTRSFPPYVSLSDLGKDAQYQIPVGATFLRAVDNGVITSTLLVDYPSLPGDPLLATFYIPTYATSGIPSTDALRRQYATGFIAASIDLRILLNSLFVALPDLDGNIELAAVTNTQNTDTNGCSLNDGTVLTISDQMYQRITTTSEDTSVANSSTLCLADRLWQLTCTPSAAAIRSQAGTAPAIYLVAVGVVTLLLAILLHRLVRISLLSRRIDAANQKKSQYLSFVCHEIRNPLHAIVGMNTLLSESGLHPKQLDYCDSIASSAHLMSAIVNDVLDLNKIEAGKLELENVSFDLRSLVSDIEEVYRLIADSKIQWAVNVDERVPRIVVGDPTRLRQMMTNFISNSFKFTRQGSVQLRIIFIKDLGSKVTISFSVVDTGLGIAAENIPKLFRAYSQAQASILRDFGGTGLGLSIVKSLADAMNGRVQVQSTIGRGSTFSFELTMDKGETDPPSQHHIVSTRQSGLIKTDWREEVKRGVEAARQHTAHEEYVLEMSRSAGALSPMGGHDSGQGGGGGGSTTPNRGFGGRMRSEYKLNSRAGVYINASRLHELRAPEDSSNSNAANPSMAGGGAGSATALQNPNNYGTSGTTTATQGVAAGGNGATAGTNAAGAPVKWSPPSSPSTQSHAEHKLRLSTSSGMPTGGAAGGTPVHTAPHTHTGTDSNGSSDANTPTAALAAAGGTTGVILSAAAAAAAAAAGNTHNSDATGSPERLTVITAGIDNAMAAGTPGASNPGGGSASGALGELRSPEYRPSSRANPSRFKGSPTPPGANPDAGNGNGSANGGNGHHGHGNNAIVSQLPPDILPIRVLLVEDNAVNRKLGLHILARTGLEPDAATDGLDCVHKCNNHQYDLILMDVQMPRMDGIQATQALRSRGLVTPIVALTANAMASERTKCIQSGMDEFVTKPFKPEQLLNVVLERAAIRVPRWSFSSSSAGTTGGNNGGVGSADHHPLGPSSSADPGDHARPPAVRDEAAWLCEQRERRAQVLRALWERERPARARKLKGPPGETKSGGMGGQAPAPVVSAAVARRAEKRMSSGSSGATTTAGSAAAGNGGGSGTLSASVASAAAAAAANAQMLAAAAQAQAAMSLMTNTGVVTNNNNNSGHSPAHATSSIVAQGTPTGNSPHHGHIMTPARRSGGTPTHATPNNNNGNNDARTSGNLHTMSWERKRSETSPNHGTTTIATNGMLLTAATGMITQQAGATVALSAPMITGGSSGTPAAVSTPTTARTLSPMVGTQGYHHAAAVMSSYVAATAPPFPASVNVAASPTPPQHFVLPPPPLGVATAANGTSSSSLSTLSNNIVAHPPGAAGHHGGNGHSSATPSSGGSSNVTRSHGDDAGDESSPPVSDIAPLTAMSPSAGGRTLQPSKPAAGDTP